MKRCVLLFRKRRKYLSVCGVEGLEKGLLENYIASNS
jgi:hypothetical protein